jgi:hypothetical protein
MAGLGMAHRRSVLLGIRTTGIVAAWPAGIMH